MKFCPKCDVRLQKTGSGLACPKCGHSAEDDSKPVQKQEQPPASTINVIDPEEAARGQSTIKKECEKCGNDQAVWWMLQTRSADEPTTQFYRCTKCSYTWRDYS